MRALLKATLLPLLLLAACQTCPERPSSLVEELQSLKGREIRVYLVGSLERSLRGTVKDVKPDLLALDYEYSSGANQPPIRGTYFISIDRISAVSLGEK